MVREEPPKKTYLKVPVAEHPAADIAETLVKGYEIGRLGPRVAETYGLLEVVF